MSHPSPIVTAELEEWYGAWGRWYHIEPPPPEEDRGSSRTRAHPIAQALPFAPKTVKAAAQQLLGRSGFDRRRIMGRSAGVRIVPMSFVDPIPCKEGARGGGGGFGWGRSIPPQIERIEREVRGLEQINFVRGIVFRAQFCCDGDRSDKALWATAEWRKVHPGAVISLGQYRNELAFARVWMHARLTQELLTRLVTEA